MKIHNITKDTILSYEKLAPGKYNLKLIYDKNNNDKWDTGDYLKNIQPERTLLYKNKINIKSNWETHADWIIKHEE